MKRIYVFVSCGWCVWQPLDSGTAELLDRAGLDTERIHTLELPDLINYAAVSGDEVRLLPREGKRDR